MRAVNGVLQAHYYQTDKKVYTITNQTDRPRIVFVEHPFRERWTLSADTEAFGNDRDSSTASESN